MNTIRRRMYILIIVILTIVFVSGCSAGDQYAKEDKKGGTESTNVSSGIMSVHFIDVGQADSIIIKTPSGKTMLIDAGNNGDKDTITSYIKGMGISKIDVLVGTHPHEDHIGSLDTVIQDFPVGNIYMPKVSSTTKTYKDVVDAIKSKNMKVTQAKAGMQFELDEGITVRILSPVADKYEELNDYSAVLKLTYKNVSFLFTGDAGRIAEMEMLNGKENLAAQVLKVGHHGSSTSTTDQFIDAVDPEYAVISVGKGNDYGHPALSTLNKLEQRGIKVFRTDEDGTVVLSTDGNTLKTQF